MILARFRRLPRTRNIRALYGMIVAQARTAAFYASYGVPDTVQGRFDLIVLHMVLVLHRLSSGSDRPGQAGNEVGQALFDVFCRDLDDNLREMGVGDLRVPKEMRRFGEAYYGRRLLTAALSPLPLARRSLRRRWHAISLRSLPLTSEPSEWRVMRARRPSS